MQPEATWSHPEPELSPAVHAALVTAGYRLVQPARGSRRGPLQRWLVLADDGTPAHADVLGSAPSGHGSRDDGDWAQLAAREELAARARTLQALRHPHLVAVREVLEVRADAGVDLVVVSDRVPGTDLLAWGRSRGPFTAGEGVTLGVPVLQALSALHARGLVHGDVSAANVVIDPDGRPVVVDVLCGARDVEAGTPGTRSPEREAGGRAQAAGDVYAAAALVLALLEPQADADAEAGAEAGTRTWDGATAVTRVERVLRPALDRDPERRPGAADLAEDLLAAAEAEPIRGGADQGTTGAASPVSPGLGAAGQWRRRTPDVLAGLPTVHRDPGERRSVRRGAMHRGRSSRLRRLAPLAVLGLLGLGAWAFTPLLTGPHEAAAHPGAVSDPSDPVGAAVALTALRAEVLGGEDAGIRLTEVVEPGSPAHRADRDLVDELRARGLRYEGLSATVLEAATTGGRSETVRVRSTMSAHRQVAADGTVRREVPARDGTVDLVLVWGADGWRVSEVLAPL